MHKVLFLGPARLGMSAVLSSAIGQRLLAEGVSVVTSTGEDITDRCTIHPDGWIDVLKPLSPCAPPKRKKKTAQWKQNPLSRFPKR